MSKKKTKEIALNVETKKFSRKRKEEEIFSLYERLIQFPHYKKLPTKLKIVKEIQRKLTE